MSLPYRPPHETDPTPAPAPLPPQFDALEPRRMLAGFTPPAPPLSPVADIGAGLDYTRADVYLHVWINQAEIPAAVRAKLTDVDRDGVISFADLNAKANAGAVADANHNGYVDAADLLRPVADGGFEDGVNGRGFRGDVYVDDIVGWNFAAGTNDPFNADAAVTDAAVAAIAKVSGTDAGRHVSVVIARVTSDVPAGEQSQAAQVAAAVRYAVANGAGAVVISDVSRDVARGGTVQAALDEAVAAGVTTFVAAAPAGAATTKAGVTLSVAADTAFIFASDETWSGTAAPATTVTPTPVAAPATQPIQPTQPATPPTDRKQTPGDAEQDDTATPTPADDVAPTAPSTSAAHETAATTPVEASTFSSRTLAEPVTTTADADTVAVNDVLPAVVWWPFSVKEVNGWISGVPFN